MCKGYFLPNVGHDLGAAETPKNWFNYLFYWFFNPLSNIIRNFRQDLESLLATDDISTQFDDHDPATSFKPVYVRVPGFYAAMDGDHESFIFIFLALPWMASAFGAIHCAGWSLHFPSKIELQIWRISSLSITCIPLIDIVLGAVLDNKTRQEGILKFLFSEVLRLAFYASFPIYLGARLLLLTVAFTTLRNLPPGALAIVKWTSFIPHVT